MKKLFLLLAVICLTVATAHSQVTNHEGQKRHINKDMPSFRGGDIEDFRIYIQNTVKYPEQAIQKGATGMVYVGFTINKFGWITNVNIIRSVEPSLDAAVVKAVKDAPNWRHNGRRRNVTFTVPVNFILK